MKPFAPPGDAGGFPLLRLPVHAAARGLDFRPPPPIGLTLSLNDVCNLKCETCDIWKPSPGDRDSMTLAEWRSLFSKLGFRPYWITVTGGEPFLREDAADIVEEAMAVAKPSRMTLVTNGLNSDRTEAAARRVAAAAAAAACRVAFHVSFDGPAALHDRIRGREGAFERSSETLLRLKKLSGPFFEAGVSVTLSKWNAETFPLWGKKLLETLKPDVLVAEIAMGRKEFGVSDEDVRPSGEAIRQCLEELIDIEKNNTANPRHVFRKNYYLKLKESYFSKAKTMFPCYAGWASAQIFHDGSVVACGVLGERLGELRTADYDFMKVWRGRRAQAVRRAIRDRNCQCSQSNIAYVNQLFARETWRDLIGQASGWNRLEP